MIDSGAFGPVRRVFEDAASRLLASDAGQRLILWHEGLGARERRALAVLAVLCGALAVYALVFAPLERRIDAARAHLVREQQLLHWLQAQRSVAQTVYAAVPDAAARPLAVTANAVASEFGLAFASMRPAGNDGVRVELRDVVFADTVRWFAALRREGVRIDAFTIDTRPGALGRVDVNVTLRG
ncbi:MAG: hypothetical protein CALGDGBN_00815 [Pseudomonadales bacterium]|nr:hypothetical protein [Pseudomonadales bacterium]